MSLSAVRAPQDQSHQQPFQCHVCQSRFTRHENLKRHIAQHLRSPNEQSLTCELCHVTFSREDLRQRHMKRKHPQYDYRREPRTGSRAQRRHSKLSDNTQAEPGVSDALQSASTSETSRALTPQNSEDDEDGRDENMNGSDHWQMPSPEQLQLQSRSHTQTLQKPRPRSTQQQISPGTNRHQTSQLMDISFVTGSPGNMPDNLTPTLSSTSPAGHSSSGTTFYNTSRDFNLPIAPASVAPQTTSPMTGLQGFGPSQASPGDTFTAELSSVTNDWFPSELQISRGIELFFEYVSHYVSFLHRPTLEASAVAGHLLLSMLSLAYQHGDDPNQDGEAGSGAELSLLCFQQARLRIAWDEEWMHGPNQNIALVQSYLLLQIYSMMYLCGKDSSYSLTTHSKMITLARATGLMQPLRSEPSTTKDLDALWRDFIRSESHKRTFYALHQIDTMWYMYLSIPRHLSHLEIKHTLPCPTDHWTASTAGEWAHRTLISADSGSSIQYPDAIRRFLSADTDLHIFGHFDPYGAINISHFLVSSAREISGWSTMTGMVGIERLEPLRASLLALGPFIRPQSELSTPPHSTFCEATWESAMLELQMWSPTHTGGIVGGSMDAVLQQLTHLAPPSELLCETSMAESIQPHVDWFLNYLDTTIATDYEAPWVTLYVYKAFIVAWQLIRGGAPGAMQVVNVGDGDTQAALEWARKVFRRRQRWKLGKIIIRCLDTLGSWDS